MTRHRLLLEEFIPYRLSVASNAVSDAIASAYEALFGLRIPEWRLITVIAESAGITQQAIGLRTRMDKVMVSRAAIALAERGLVLRQPNPADQRSHLLVLSADGRRLYARVVPKALELEAHILRSFEPAELAVLATMLRRIETAALEKPGRVRRPKAVAGSSAEEAAMLMAASLRRQRR